MQKLFFQKHPIHNLFTTILLLGGGLFAAAGLTSCDNFLNGSKVRDEIVETIAYNNAPTCTVMLKADADKGEFSSDGEKSFKVGYNSEVQFTVNQDNYVFKSLEAVSRSDTSVSRSDCVEFTPVSSDSRKGIYKINIKILKQTNDILIRPVCTPLPKIQSVEPDSKITSAQDTKIVITFNKPVDPASFGNFSGLSITSNGIPVDDYFAAPEFFNNNTTLSIVPLSATDATKLLLPPDEAVEIREIQVSYIFSGETDSLGNAIKGNLEHKYRINKDFGKKKTVKVLVEADAEQGKFLSSGLTDCTVNYTFDVQFTVKKNSYSFIDFEAVSINNEAQSRMSSVEIENKEYDDETGIYKARVRVKDTPENTDIRIRPICRLIPKISNITPALEANGSNQDSVIKIAFNKAMNPATFKDSNGKIKGLSVTTTDGDDLSSYFEEAFFTSDNKTLCLQPLCITDNTKYLLAPDGSKNSLNIEVGYTFVGVKDDDGLDFTANGTHSYKINKNFDEQEEVTVRVENPNTAYGSFLSAGEKKCIVGFGFDIQFTLNKESYIFQGFEATGQGGESRASYVSFENQNFDNESGVYKTKVRVIQSADDIIIRPKCQLITNTGITINGKKGAKSIIPANGTTVTSFIDRNYSISFSPDDDYEFVKWELYDINTDDAIPNGMYVTIADSKQAETSYKVTRVPADTIKLGLRALVAERPQLISNTPQNGGILKDSTIQVIFDRDMDENSIYYTDDEIDELLALGVKKNEFLPEIPAALQNNYGNHYGYTKNGKTYLKNISLTNNKGGENLNDKFEAPFFENARTLSIPASKVQGSTLDDYTQVLVTIEKGFFYSEPLEGQETKPITLRGSKKWMYQVTNHGDEEALVFHKKDDKDLFTLKLKKENSTALTSETAHPTIQNNGTGIRDLKFLKIKNEKPTLYCDMELQDVTGGSGPNSTFTVCYERIKEADYITAGKGEKVTGSFGHEYTATTSQDAILKGDLSLDLPADGLYRIWFDFTDRSNNHFYYPANANEENSKVGFYVVKDESSVSEPSNIIVESGANDNDYKLSWTAPQNLDYDHTVITVTGETETLNTVNKGITEATINNILSGQSYEISITHYDYAGNKISSSVPKFLTGLSVDGTPSFGIAESIFFADDTVDSYNLTATVYYSDGTSSYVSSSILIPSSVQNIAGNVTFNYKENKITQTDDFEGLYYIASSGAKPTESPVALTGYTGTYDNYKDGKYYKESTYYAFGDFPQTIAEGTVTFSDVPVYKGWYLGSDGYFYAKCTENANESKYTYSNGDTVAQASANSEKYFKVEPIVWRALITTFDHDADGTGDKILLLAESVLTTNVPYYGNSLGYTYYRTLPNGSKIYNNNYKYSNIRAYLNGTANQFVTDGGTATEYDVDWTDKGFLQAAFTSTAQKLIATTTVDNSEESTNPEPYPSHWNKGKNTYACDNTRDKIFLLSDKEATTHDYGFDDYGYECCGDRTKKPTDYALANHLSQSTTDRYGSSWWLRSPFWTHQPQKGEAYDSYTIIINNGGSAQRWGRVCYSYRGVVPALCVAPEALE